MLPTRNTFVTPSRRTPSARTPRDRTARPDVLLTLVDFGLISAMFGVPLLFGGRYAAGHFLLVLSAGLASLSWCLRQVVRPTPQLRLLPAYGVALLSIAVVSIQLVPLSADSLAAVSPATSELLPMWFSPDAQPSLPGSGWDTVSLAPAETRSGLSTLLAYVLLFFVATQRIQSRADLERILRWIAIGTLAMATLGLLQYFLGNGKFFWVLDPPFRKSLWAVTGSFTNRNHFVQYLSLGIGPLLLWLLHSRTDAEDRSQTARRSKSAGTGREPSWRSAIPTDTISRRYLRTGLGLSVVLVAVLLSESRGGLVAVAVAAITYALIGARSAALKGRLAAAAAGSVLVVAAFLLFYGDQFLHGRLETLLSGDFRALDPDQSRQQIWTANIRAWKHFPVLGTGVGTHREVYPVFLQRIDDGHEFTHAESGYLQIASETGTCGVLVLLAALGLCVYWCLKSRSQAAGDSGDSTSLLVAAVASGLAASCVQSLADFVWYIPGCMTTTVILMASANRLGSLTRPNTRSRAPESPGTPPPHAATPDLKSVPRSLWAVGTLGIAAAVCWMVSVQVGELRAEKPWQTYVRDAVYNTGHNRDRLAQQRLHLALLRQAAQADPTDARIQLRLVSTCRSLFEYEQEQTANPLSLMQIRQTAAVAGFESREQLHEWLARATGEHLDYLFQALEHARRAIQLCPLQGQAYVHLAELEFLEHPDVDPRAAYYTQAKRVRPADAHVLFAAGQFEWFTGNEAEAISCWRKAFRYHSGYRELIIHLLAEHVPVQFFLENFQPDVDALSTLQKFYLRADRPQERRIVLKQQAGIALARAKQSRGTDAIPNWLLAHDACDALEASRQAEMCLREALKLNPGSFELRERMGRWLFRQQRYEEASQHLNWCSERHPGDRQLRDLAELALERRVQSASERFAVNPPDRS